MLFTLMHLRVISSACPLYIARINNSKRLSEGTPCLRTFNSQQGDSQKDLKYDAGAIGHSDWSGSPHR